MKQLALEVVARTLDPAQISLLGEEFDRADKTNNGEVTAPAFTALGCQNLFLYARAECRRPVQPPPCEAVVRQM